MEKLFRIKDYIGVTSANFMEELKGKFIHFDEPSKDVRYWKKNCKSAAADILRKWFSCETLLVDDNELSLELPRQMAYDEEMVLQLVENGRQALYRGAFPFPKVVYRFADINVQFLPGSFYWKVEGRVLTLFFSTKVTLLRPVPRLSASLLENGVKYHCGQIYNLVQMLQEIVTTPNEVEFFRAGENYYLLKKSNEEKVARRKYELLYGHVLKYDNENIFNIAKIFAPDYFEKIFSGITDVRPKRRKSYFLYSPLKDNFYSVFDQNVPESTLSYLEYLDELNATLKKCIEKISGVTNYINIGAARKSWNFEFPFSGGKVVLCIDSPHDCSEILSEIQQRIRLNSAVSKFLWECVGPDVSLCDYTFNKIKLDPILYTGPESGSFSSAGLSMI